MSIHLNINNDLIHEFPVFDPVQNKDLIYSRKVNFVKNLPHFVWGSVIYWVCHDTVWKSYFTIVEKIIVNESLIGATHLIIDTKTRLLMITDKNGEQYIFENLV